MSAAEQRSSDSLSGSTVLQTRHPIVVGVDDSPASANAADWAAAEAALRRLPLHIVHTWTWQHLAPWLTEADRMVMGDLQRAGKKLVGRCRATAVQHHHGLEVTTDVRQGQPADVLTDLGRDATMLVVGNHHLRTLGRVVLGSASSAVVAHANCPTVVVSKPPASSGPGQLVVGLAAAADDQQVLRFAFDHAQRHDLPLRALYCWYPDALAANKLPIPSRADAWLAEALAGWRAEYPDVSVEAEVRRVHPVTGLVEEAQPADLLVVGRRAHRSRFAGHLGSVSLGALHHARCSVVVVPS